MITPSKISSLIPFANTIITRHSQTIQEMEDWKFIGMVLDRLFLWVFTVAVLGGTVVIILRAPSLYDLRLAPKLQTCTLLCWCLVYECYFLLIYVAALPGPSAWTEHRQQARCL